MTTQLISAATLAEAWEVSSSQIYALIKRKNDPLPARRIGQAWRIDPDEAEAWSDRYRNTTTLKGVAA